MASTPVAIQERRSEDVGRATDRSEGTEGRAWTKQEDPGTKLMEEAGEQQAPGSSEDDDEEEGKHGPWQATINGLKAFWRFFTKPLGFFVTIYMLNGKLPSHLLHSLCELYEFLGHFQALWTLWELSDLLELC